MKDMLNQVEAAIEGAIRPQHADGVQEAVLKARKVIYNREMTAKLIDDMGRMTVDDPQKIAIGVSGILSMLRGDPNGRFEDALLVPVASLVAVDLMRFLEEAELFAPDAAFVGNAFEELYAVLMQKLNIEPADMQQLAAQAQQIDPNNPEVLARQQGGIIDGAAA